MLLEVYRNPGRRSISDLDLLVPQHDLHRAHALLGRHAARVLHRLAPHRHIGEIVLEGEAGMIELHGADDHAGLWPQIGDPLTSGGLTSLESARFYLPTLTNLWLHAACHGMAHGPHVWLHKLRRAMVRPGRDRLQGVVEVDETYVGGVCRTPPEKAWGTRCSSAWRPAAWSRPTGCRAWATDTRSYVRAAVR